jgi:tetratricopeptide (TPR) repeat protein
MKKIVYLLILLPMLMLSQTNFDKAEKLFFQEKYTIAKPVFESFLKENPNNLKAIEYLGDVAIHLKDFDGAITYYDKLKKLKPTEADYYYKYGGALGLKAKDGGKWVAIRLIGDMKASFEKAIALNPNHIEARWAMIEYYLQVPGLFGGSEKKAQRYANELMRLSPVDGYLSKGHIDEYFERYKSAEKNYMKAIEIGGSKTTYDRLVALYRVKLHQPEKAIRVLENYKEKIKS